MTWSIVAVDPQTGEVGAAAATCTVGVEVIHRIVPGRGVIVAQAATNLRARNRGARLISAGRSADDVVAAVANRRFNPGRLGARPWTEQQYGVAVLGPEPNAANYTGAETVPWSGARSADGCSVQGNMLRGPAVVEAAFAAMSEVWAQPGDLADRLVRGLEAGAAEGGDHRCGAERAALTAFVAVARRDDPAGRPSTLLVAPRAFGLAGALRHRLIPVTAPAGSPPPVQQLRSWIDRRSAGG